MVLSLPICNDPNEGSMAILLIPIHNSFHIAMDRLIKIFFDF